MSGASHVVTVLLDDELLAFNRVIGVVRRRNLPTEDLAVGPSERAGVVRLTLFLHADDANAERLLRQLEKTHGVHGAAVVPAAEVVAREVALVKVRARPEERAAVLAVVSQCGATSVEEGADVIIAEVSGGRETTAALVRGLARFGVLEIARSGAVVVRGPGPRIPALTHSSEAVP